MASACWTDQDPAVDAAACTMPGTVNVIIKDAAKTIADFAKGLNLGFLSVCCLAASERKRKAPVIITPSTEKRRNRYCAKSAIPEAGFKAKSVIATTLISATGAHALKVLFFVKRGNKSWNKTPCNSQEARITPIIRMAKGKPALTPKAAAR